MMILIDVYGFLPKHIIVLMEVNSLNTFAALYQAWG